MQYIDIDINKKYYRKLEIKQGDVGITKEFRTFKDGAVFDLSDKAVFLYVQKPDKTVVFIDTKSVTNNVATFEIPNQMIIVNGIAYCELVISKNDNIISSIPFDLEIVASVRLMNDNPEKSENVLTAFDNAIEQIGDYKSEINKVITETNASVNTLKTSFEAQTIELENKFNTAMSNMLLKLNDYYNKIYPVGYIWESTSNVNPQTIYGGTWEQYGSGKVLIGVGTVTDSAGTTKTFTANEVGGEINHTLTINEMPSHDHEQFVTANNGGSIKGRADYNTDADNNNKYTQGIRTGSTGGGQAHNNLQPYVVVYRWKRTALATSSDVSADDLLTEFLVNNLIDTDNIKDEAVTTSKINTNAMSLGSNYNISINNTSTANNTQGYSICYFYLTEPSIIYNDGTYYHHYSFDFTPVNDIATFDIGVRKSTNVNTKTQSFSNLKANETYHVDWKWSSTSVFNAIWIKAIPETDGVTSIDGTINNFRFNENHSNLLITKTKVNNVDNPTANTTTGYVTIELVDDKRLVTSEYLNEEYNVNIKNVKNINNTIDERTLTITNSSDISETRIAVNLTSNATLSDDDTNEHYVYFRYTPANNIDKFHLKLMRGTYVSDIISKSNLVAGETYTFSARMNSAFKAVWIKFYANANDTTATASLDGVITNLQCMTNGVSNDFTTISSSQSNTKITSNSTNNDTLVSISYLDFKLKELEQKLTGATTYNNEG